MGRVKGRARSHIPTVALDSFDEFAELWHGLQVESRTPGTVILVEGERDRRSLRRLGFVGPIALVHQGRSLSRTAQEMERGFDRVIVLTDWDVEGGHLAQRLRPLLEAGSLAVDLDTRRRLARVLRGEVVHVEGLAGWARRNAERRGASIDHFLPPGEG
ncbi:MAG: toprim domain-containing protein [Thermoplasmata archaeon]|jgi:5S rRNA maturation endonuclease (ribonuclease M5)